MTEWIISSSVLIVIIAALRFFLKGKISLRLQYALWGLVLVRLLLPFSIGSSEISVMNFIPESMRQEQWEESYETVVIQGGELMVSAPANTDNSGPEMEKEDVSGTPGIVIENASVENAGQSENGELQEMKSEVNLSELWNVVWLLGGLLAGSVLLAANGMFWARLRKSRKKLENMVCALPVYVTETVDTPCLFGLFRPAIYLTPEAVENEVALRHVLEHEMTHYRHGDHIWSVLRGVCLAVHWYNPLVWWAAVLSRTDAELACDEATIKRLGEQERAEYGRTLIAMTCRKRTALLVTATTMTGSKNGLKERITLIVKKPKMAVYTLILVIVLAVAAVGCTFTGNKKEVEADNAVTPTAVPTEMAASVVTITSIPTPGTTIIPTLTPVPEGPIITVMPTAKPELVFDIQAELNAVEKAYQEKQQKLQTDPYLTQADMNSLAGECATLWEEAMDTFWNVLEPLLTAEEVNELNIAQQEWLNERDAEVQAAIAEYDGGSLTGTVVGQIKARLTRERVYELADQLEERVAQAREALQQDYSGYYVNTQGTDVVYDELKLKLLEDGSYQVEIGIYRLTTLEGIAVSYGDILMFEDTDMQVKGNIQFDDGMAVFTVTESYFEYITPGEGFEFYKE